MLHLLTYPLPCHCNRPKFSCFGFRGFVGWISGISMIFCLFVDSPQAWRCRSRISLFPIVGCLGFAFGFIGYIGFALGYILHGHFAYSMSCIFGKLMHQRSILAIWKKFQCITRGVRILLANCTQLSATSETLSH